MKKFLLLSLLALPLIADDAQPLSKNFGSLGVGYGPMVVPFVEYGREVKSGFYDVMNFQVTGIKGGIQTSVTNGPCYFHTLGEYIVLGGCGKLGMAMDGNAKGAAEGGNASIEYRFGKSQHWGFKAGGDFLNASVGGLNVGVKASVVFHWN